MRVLAIRGRNLASLEGEFSIDFTEEPLASAGNFAISGPTGAGKSTLLDAMCLALFSRTPRTELAKENNVRLRDVQEDVLPQSDPRFLLRRGTASGYAEVDFVALNGCRYRRRGSVSRAREKESGRLQAARFTLYNIFFGKSTFYRLLPKEYEKDFFDRTEALLGEVNATLSFYDTLSADIRNSFEKLRVFVSHVNEADRFDEEHLLPIALEVFGSVPFPVTTEYVPIKKASRSKTATLARRLYFDSYYSFVMTDFFEGLHYGHYPRRCDICKKYFLMTSAARQKYCTGYAPFKLKGKAITCRKYAARINRKELAAGNPVIRIYKNRCSVLRMERKRGTVTEEFASTALDLAKERMQRAKEDAEYANSQYESDMSREKLYAEVDKQLK